jgi:hypothetical protein
MTAADDPRSHEVAPPLPPQPYASEFPRFAWFEGIVEGQRIDERELRAAVGALESCGLAPLSVEVDAGRFSLLAPDHAIAPHRLRPGWRAEVAHHLQSLALQLPPSGSLESTLRCTEVFETETVETLFAVRGRDVRAVSRGRETTASDLQRATRRSRPAAPKVSRRNTCIAALAIAVLVPFVLFRVGVVDRIFAPAAADLVVSTGAFGDLVAATVADDAGTYVVTLTRGAGFPATTAAADALLAAAPTPERRAIVRAVTDGGVAFVQLRSSNDTLAVAEIALRGLLPSDDARVRTTLPARIGAATVELTALPGR